MEISHFEIEFNKRTEARDYNQRGRLFMHTVVMQIHRINNDTYRLTHIQTLSLLRGNGYASIALNWLCRLADAYQIKLELCPVQLENKAGLDLVALTAWYQRHGFYRIGLVDEMIRLPQRLYVERNHNEKATPYLVQ